MYYILWFMIITVTFNMICAEKTTLINNDFFKDIVGMDEETFQTTFTSRPIVFSPEKQNEWIKDNPRRAAIFYGYPKNPATYRGSIITSFGKININRGISIAEYEALLKKQKIEPLTNKPVFSIQFYDPLKLQDSDIRWLQANPELKDVVFQIASNFNTLEGGMGFPNARLTNMLEMPVQGEFASISAASATIRRKYFMDPFNLLFQLQFKNNGIEMNENDGFANPTDQTLQKISNGLIDANKIDYKDIAVCLQSVVVTSGSGGTSRNAEIKRLDVTLNSDGTIDENKTQTVWQVFSAALDLRNFKKRPLNPNLEKFAKLIIKASYEGVLKAAFFVKQEKVFFTIMGGGSFRNDLKWIAEALESLEGFIKEKGMQVVLMYRPDKPRPQDPEPIRTAKGDIDFLNRMVTLANKINNTTYNLDATIKNYVTNGYSEKLYSIDKKEVEEAKKPYSSEAQKLQEKFPLNNFYTPTPSKVPSIPPTTTVPPTTIPVTQPLLTDIPTNIITSFNKFTKGLRAIDALLKKDKDAGKDDTTYKVGSKTIELIVGDITDQKNIDVLVNAANTSVATVGSAGIALAINKKMTDDEKNEFAENIKTRYGGLTTGKVGGAYLGELKKGSVLNNLGYRYLINAVGPNCGAGEDVNLVADAYRNSLDEAAKVGAKSIVIPRISAIIFGCDPTIIDPLAVETVVQYLSANPDSLLKTVYLIFYPGQPLDMTALEKYKELLNKKLKK